MRKTFAFGFFKIESENINNAAESIPPSQVLLNILGEYDAGRALDKTVNGVTYEIKRMQSTDYGYRGVIVKHRKSNLPSVGRIGGVERQLDIEDEENLLEKTHFVYFHQNNLMILQANQNAIRPSSFASYLQPNNHMFNLDPIIKPDFFEYIARDSVQIRAVQLRVAKPTNEYLIRTDFADDITNTLAQSVNSTQGCSFNFSVRGDGHSIDPERRYIDSRFKSAIRDIKSEFDCDKLVVESEDTETGFNEPIDLLGERLIHYTKVNMNGRYPDMHAMWCAAFEAKEEKENELRRYFAIV
ncbi:DUF6731 family protein [Vibrio lentus]|uniref:DUF6731 family protein n=1 Tax=Vibrio lentus TaxID=136468 RepID=UPI0040641084